MPCARSSSLMVIANPAAVAVLAMAFSHINLDASGTPPGRNDPCSCGSGKKTKRCCGVDRCRFLPLRGRHRGVVPADLAARVDEMAGDFTVRFLGGRSCRRVSEASPPPRCLRRSAASCASCSATSASSSTRRSRSSSGSATGDREAGGLVQSARTGSGAASVWTGLSASSRGRLRSGCRPRRTRTAMAATTAKTSTARSCARRRSAPGISGSSRLLAGCGTRAIPLPPRTPR